MADISPAIDIWSQAYCRATAYTNGTAQSISGVTSVDGTPRRRMVLCINSRNRAVEAIALSDVSTGAYEIVNLPAGEYEVIAMGEGVKKSDIIGPIEIS